MANKYIINLPEKTAVNDSDIVIVEDAASTKRITWANLKLDIDLDSHKAESATKAELGHVKKPENYIPATPILLNGTTQATPSLVYYKDAFGHVYVHGAIANSALSLGVVLLEMPVGYRPLVSVGVPAIRANDGSLANLYMSSSGTLIYHGDETGGTFRINTMFRAE